MRLPRLAAVAAFSVAIAASAGPALATRVQIDLAGTQGLSAKVNVATAATTQLVAAVAGARILVAQVALVAGGADDVTLEYGSGSSCSTGTTALSGQMNLGAGGVVEIGDGAALVAQVPAGDALCIVTSAAVQLGGLVTYVQQP